MIQFISRCCRCLSWGKEAHLLQLSPTILLMEPALPGKVWKGQLSRHWICIVCIYVYFYVSAHSLWSQRHYFYTGCLSICQCIRVYVCTYLCVPWWRHSPTGLPSTSGSYSSCNSLMALTLSLSPVGGLTVCVDMLVVVKNGRVLLCRTATPSVTVCCLSGVPRWLSRPTPAVLPGELLPALSVWWLLLKLTCGKVSTVRIFDLLCGY